MESVNLKIEDVKHPILTSIFNQSFLDEYKNKRDNFLILSLCTFLLDVGIAKAIEFLTPNMFNFDLFVILGFCYLLGLYFFNINF